jgi:hypothetical protein
MREWDNGSCDNAFLSRLRASTRTANDFREEHPELLGPP